MEIPNGKLSGCSVSFHRKLCFKHRPLLLEHRVMLLSGAENASEVERLVTRANDEGKWGGDA